jgi:hypothetical protein
MIKTKSFKSKDLQDLGNQITNWQNSNLKVEPKGSIPFFNSNTSEYCLLSFFAGEENSRESKEEMESKTKGGSSQSSDSAPKQISAPQYKALQLHGYSEIDIANMTYHDAWKIINEGVKKKQEKKSKSDFPIKKDGHTRKSSLL